MARSVIHYLLVCSLFFSVGFVPFHQTSHLGSEHSHHSSIYDVPHNHSSHKHSDIRVIDGYDLPWEHSEQELESNCAICLLASGFSAHVSPAYQSSASLVEQVVFSGLASFVKGSLFSAYSPRAPPSLQI